MEELAQVAHWGAPSRCTVLTCVGDPSEDKVGGPAQTWGLEWDVTPAHACGLDVYTHTPPHPRFHMMKHLLPI